MQGNHEPRQRDNAMRIGRLVQLMKTSDTILDVESQAIVEIIMIAVTCMPSWFSRPPESEGVC